MNASNYKAFELLLFFLDRFRADMSDENLESLGKVFWAGLMATPEIVPKLHADWMLASLDAPSLRILDECPQEFPEPEVIQGKRYKITIRRPVK